MAGQLNKEGFHFKKDLYIYEAKFALPNPPAGGEGGLILGRSITVKIPTNIFLY